jgi:hypothetical protein
LRNQHIESAADLTISCIPVNHEAAPGFGIMETDDALRITRFVEKPSNPAILKERQYDSYNYGILTGHQNIELNLNLLSCIKNEEGRYYKNPSIFKINDDHGEPYRSAGRENIFIANVTSTEYCMNCSGSRINPNSKLMRVPFEYFPNLEKELNNTLISNSSFNMVIQFNKLDDVSGISAIYKFVDRRTIEDINKIKSYKIYSNN